MIRGVDSSNGPRYHTHTVVCQLMPGYTNFAVIGAGSLGNYIVEQLLKDKAAGVIKEVVLLTRQVCYPYKWLG